MSLAGTLDELPLIDIFDMVFLAEKTGRLSLTCTSAEGMVVFRKGRIIYASSNSAREAFGNILVCLKLVDEATLRKALVKQHHSREERRLGRILVEMGALKPEDLENVVQHQIERVLVELFSWREGFFKFEALDIPDRGEVEVDGREFLAERGLNTRKVALDLARQQDEVRRPGARPAPAAGKRAPAGGPKPSPPPQPPPTGEPVTLRQIIAGHARPSLTAETTMELLRRASGALARGVLLLVEQHGVVGVGQFGLADDDVPADERARSLWLPLDEPSVLAQVVRGAATYRGCLPEGRVHDVLVAQLGGAWPQEVAVLPVVASGRVVALLYGDNEPERAPIPALEPLSAQLASVGRRMEAPARPARAAS
ncbi:MAG: DUF4388 domain-containing protein [Thermoanaerobaculaceae bacterium]